MAGSAGIWCCAWGVIDGDVSVYSSKMLVIEKELYGEFSSFEMIMIVFLRGWSWGVPLPPVVLVVLE